MLLAGATASAQIVTSKSRLVTKVKKPPFEKTFYIAGGGKMNTLQRSTFSFKPGYEAAFGYEQNFKRNKKFGSQFGFEVGVTSLGYKFDQPQMNYEHSASIPVIFVSPFTYSYRIGFGKKKKTWFEPYVGARVGSGIFNEDYYYPDSWSTGGVSYEPYCEGYEHERGFDTHFQVFLNAGVRLWVAGRVSIDLNYQQGLLYVAEENFEYNVRNYNSNTDSWFTNSKWISEEVRAASICLRVGVKLNK